MSTDAMYCCLTLFKTTINGYECVILLRQVQHKEFSSNILNGKQFNYDIKILYKKPLIS